MQAEHTLEVTRREKLGSRYARRERESGKLPAVLYGQGRDPVALSLNAKEAIRFFESGEKVFNIALAAENKTQTVLLKDIQYDYLGTNIIHADLTRVELDQEVESAIPVHLIGEAKGLKASGALLQHPTTMITVRTTVRNLPEGVDVRIDDLEIGDSILAGDVELPEGVELASDAEDLIASIQMSQEEAADAEAEEVSSESAEPERVGEDKPEDEGEEPEG